jgi:hypothetical protein
MCTIGKISNIHVNKQINKFCYVCYKTLLFVSFRDHDYMGHKAPMATKSLDNIFARQLTSDTGEQQSPFLWRDATRSEEHLYHASYSFPRTTCPESKASRFSGARYV